MYSSFVASVWNLGMVFRFYIKNETIGQGNDLTVLRPDIFWDSDSLYLGILKFS